MRSLRSWLDQLLLGVDLLRMESLRVGLQGTLGVQCEYTARRLLK
jgi:hypothetical protein